MLGGYTMQLTNLQVLNVLRALNVLSQNKLPVKLSWRVTTAIRTLEPFAKATEEPLKELQMKYALRDDDGKFVEAVDQEGNAVPNTMQIPNEKVELLNREISELLNETIDVENVTFRLSEFPDSLEIEPAVLTALSPVIDPTDSVGI